MHTREDCDRTGTNDYVGRFSDSHPQCFKHSMLTTFRTEWRTCMQYGKMGT